MENTTPSLQDLHINNQGLPEANGTTMTDFDLASIALPQNYQDMVSIETIVTQVSLRRPHKHEWFRIHPSVEYRQTFYILKFEAEWAYSPVGEG